MKNGVGKVLRISEKTAIVAIERTYSHPKYKKLIKTTKKLMMHDELGVKIGDNVSFALCAPISKLKRHAIKEIL